MKKFILPALCLSTLAAFAAQPLPKAGAGSSGPLREIDLRPMRQAQASPRHISPDDALTLPAEYDFSKEAFAGYPTVDANGDGTTWKFENDYSLGGTACYESMTATAGADDWLILPFVELPSATASYTLSFQSKILVKPEAFDICISPTADISDAVVVKSVSSELTGSFHPFSADFAVPAAGKYCVMIHATSPQKGLSLYVTQVKVAQAASAGFSVPFSMTPDPEEARYFKFIDTNHDGKTWFYDTSNKGLSYEYSATDDADDYVLFPEITVSEPGNYKFTWTARGWGTSLESMEVLLGQGEDPESFTTLWTEPAVGSSPYRREVVFQIPEAGKWRPALHCSSPAGRYKLLVKEFTLDATDELPAPALPLAVQGPLDVSVSSAAFSPGFRLPETARVRVSFEAKGAALEVGIANAPSAQAASSLFSTEASADFTAVSKVMNLNAGGIRYLVFSSQGNAQVRNLELTMYSEEDEAYQLPFSMRPTAAEFLEFAVVNANNDDSYWSYYEPFNAVRYNFSNTNKADDWLVLPAINVPDADHMLTFSVSARGMVNTLPETFEVWAGKSADPSEMVKLYDSPEISSEVFTPHSFSFSPRWTGVTYMAVRATSEPKMFNLFVRDFKLEAETRTTGVPRPVADLAAEALPKGSEEAKVTFTLPTLAENGTNLSGTLTAEVKSAKATVTLTGNPGDALSTAIANGQGNGTVGVTVSNEAGSSNPASVTVYTGQDIPARVSGLKVEAGADNRSAVISWTQSETGATGGYVDPSQVTYTVRHATGGGSYTTVATVKGVESYTYYLAASSPLEMHYFKVIPSNVAGEGQGADQGAGIVLGKPHTIPATEEFASGSVELGPVGMSYPDDSYTLEWYFDNPANAFDEAANRSGKALVAFTEEEGAARGRLHLPKFDTRTDKGARVVLRLFNFPHFAPTDVFATAYGMTPVAVGRIEPSAETGWKEYSLPLPQELIGKEWVEIYLDFGFPGTEDDEIWMLDRYGMENYLDTEIDLRPVKVHTAVTANEKTEWEFQAGNYGRQAVTFSVPELHFTSADGEDQGFAATFPETSEVTLKPGETTALRYTPVADTSLEGTGAYSITVDVEADGNPDNNTLAAPLKVEIQKEYVVRDLWAERSAGSDDEVTLTWSKPETDWGILYCDNLESWQMGPRIGLFKNHDADGKLTLRFTGATYPGSGAAKAWQVFDYKDGGFDVVYAGYLGTDKSLIVFGPGDAVTRADDWLISPEVKGGTDLTFYVRPLHYAYGSETLEVLTSSTGDAPEDFVLLDTYKTKTGEATKTPYWEEVEMKLPDDARFFAIRYVSLDIFGVQLDDVIYTPAQGDDTELSYSVFRDGEKIATGVKAESYTDHTTASATYHVALEKAYGGLHPFSNRATVESSSVASVETDSLKITASAGLLTVCGAEGKSIDVTAADGKRVYSTAYASSTENIPLSTGVYVVKVSGYPTRKAIVR